MARTDRSRKRQKTSHRASSSLDALQSLGSDPILDDPEKDDEERELEAKLFGTKLVPQRHHDDEDEDEEGGDGRMDDGGRELAGMLDEDVCFYSCAKFSSQAKMFLVALLCR
jgi:hypothetical protein